MCIIHLPLKLSARLRSFQLCITYFGSTGSPLIRPFLLKRISNFKDGFLKLKNSPIFLIRTVFSEKFDFEHAQITNFKKKNRPDFDGAAIPPPIFSMPHL